ncbi:MAG: hypothetical protein GX045_06220 [Clostridiaceae bacterium]|nr:hypothetical protein [Clostridiaceae bacterium]
MALKKNEIKLLIILCVLVFGFIFVKFVLMTTIPKINEAKIRLEEVKAQKAALDEDYRNLDNYYTALEVKNTVNERLGEYLMNNAGISDSIEFIEKLALMMGTDIENISLGRPSEISGPEEIKYYGFPVSFSATMPYGDFKELLRYCEGGSKKIRVSSFSIKPEENIKSDSSADEQLFKSSISLVFYTIDKDTASKLFQFSRAKLQEFKTRDGEPIYIKEDAELPDTDLPGLISSARDRKTPGHLITMDNADFIVFHRGYLYGGYNFETYATFGSKNRIRETTAEKVEVLMTIEGNTYTIDTLTAGSFQKKITGDIPDRDFTMYIVSNVNDIKENENLFLDIKVKNNSDKTIRVHIEQKGNRVKLMDRDGNVITGKNEKEKIYL